MPHNPFADVDITGAWEDHAGYSLGGTDLPLAYGTPIPAPASGTLRTSGGSGEWQAGAVGTAGRRSILTLDEPLTRRSPARSTPYEAAGPLVAIVLQHQSAFGVPGPIREGERAGVSGASVVSGGRLLDWGGEVHLHWHGLDAAGRRLRLESFLPAAQLAGLDSRPVTTTKEEEEDMTRPTGYYAKGDLDPRTFWIDQDTGLRRGPVPVGELQTAQLFNQATGGKFGTGHVAVIPQADLDAIPYAPGYGDAE